MIGDLVAVSRDIRCRFCTGLSSVCLTGVFLINISEKDFVLCSWYLGPREFKRLK